MSEENKALAKRVFEEVWNNKNLAAVEDLFASDILVTHNTGRRGVGTEDAKQGIARFFEAFPDLRITVDQQIAEGDTVVNLLTLRASHQGVWQGISPTGQKVTQRRVIIQRFGADGKIVEITSINGGMPIEARAT